MQSDVAVTSGGNILATGTDAFAYLVAERTGVGGLSGAEHGRVWRS